ncbi:MAG: zinc ribbon domain-containing protein, partial [Methanomassiliicoccales archaeon]
MQDEHRFCIRCGRELPSRSTFCPYCGASQSPLAYTYAPPTPPRSGFEKFGDVIRSCGTGLTVALLLLVSLNVAILIWGITQVLPETVSNHTYLFVVVPFIVAIARISGDVFAIYYLLIVAAIIISFIIMVVKSLPVLREEIYIQKVKEHSAAYTIATLFAAVIAFNLLFIV